MLVLEDKMRKKDEEFEEMNERYAMELEKFMEEVKGHLAETEPIYKALKEYPEIKEIIDKKNLK